MVGFLDLGEGVVAIGLNVLAPKIWSKLDCIDWVTSWILHTTRDLRYELYGYVIARWRLLHATWTLHGGYVQHSPSRDLRYNLFGNVITRRRLFSAIRHTHNAVGHPVGDDVDGLAGDEGLNPQGTGLHLVGPPPRLGLQTVLPTMSKSP